MSSIRQQKIESAIRSELATFFLRRSTEICLGSMVTVTNVRITSDLSLARCYLSIYNAEDKQSVLENINLNKGKIKSEVAARLKNMRKTPGLTFYIDDSLDYAMQIEELLKKK
jgi:ribosome-binding factor A